MRNKPTTPAVVRPLDGRVRALPCADRDLVACDDADHGALRWARRNCEPKNSTAAQAAQRTDCTAQHVGAERPCEPDYEGHEFHAEAATQAPLTKERLRLGTEPTALAEAAGDVTEAKSGAATNTPGKR